jgi:hypothetical protein
MTEVIPSNSVSNETQLASAGSMLLNIFVSPMQVFQRIKAKPSWVLPFIIAVIVTGVASYYVTPLAMESKMEELRASGKMTDTQEQQYQQAAAYQGVTQVFGAIGGMLVAAIIVFGGAAVLLLLGTVVFGGSAKYMGLVALVSYTQMVTILGQIIKIPLIVSKNSMDLRTSLAVFLPSGHTDSAPYYLLSTLTDPFFIWWVVLAIMGIGVIYNFDTKKSSLVVLIPVLVITVIGLILKVAFA